MKKRIFSTLLALCMLLCLVPTGVFAAGTDTGKAIQLVDGGTAANISGGQNDNIYFGKWDEEPIKWRVLDDKTNTGGSGLFLLSDALLGTGWDGDVYFDNSGITATHGKAVRRKRGAITFMAVVFPTASRVRCLQPRKAMKH